MRKEKELIGYTSCDLYYMKIVSTYPTDDVKVKFAIEEILHAMQIKPYKKHFDVKFWLTKK